MSEQPKVCLCQGVCSVYQEGFKLANNACPLKGCKHDTRSRPHTPAPAQEVCEEQDACRIPAMCPEVTKAARQAREDELINLQDWREQEMKNIPFDPWVFINRENKRISKLLQSLRQQAGEP